MIRFPFVALIASVAVVACGGTPELIDAGKAEGSISKGIKRQLDLDLRVTCPRDIERAKGQQFTCTARGADTEKLPISATQKDSKGNVTWSVDLMGTTQIEESVAREAKIRRKINVTLDCPDAVELIPESSFDCDASTPEGQTDTVRVTIEDEDGNTTWAFPGSSIAEK